RLLGYTPEERIGHSGFELVHPDDVERTRAAFAEVLRQPGVPIDPGVRVRHKKGEFRDIAVVAVNPLEDKEIGAVVVNYHDVTDRRRAEQALRESESRLRKIVEHGPD